MSRFDEFMDRSPSWFQDLVLGVVAFNGALFIGAAAMLMVVVAAAPFMIVAYAVFWLLGVQ